MHPFDGEGEVHDITLSRCRSVSPGHHATDAPENGGTDSNCNKSSTACSHFSSYKDMVLHITNANRRRAPGAKCTGLPLTRSEPALRPSTH